MSSNEQILFEKLKALPLVQRRWRISWTCSPQKPASAPRSIGCSRSPGPGSAGIEPMSEEGIDAEVEAVRAERRAPREPSK